ncbi:MAG: hypothetical protein AAB557_02215 [Patescibacteria group bacterium]
MNVLQTIQINPSALQKDFDPILFENISWSNALFRTHREIAAALQDKNPYTITVIIDPLKWELRNRKEYVKKTKKPMVSKYRKLLYSLFFEEFGQREGNDLFATWLERYRPVWQQSKKYETIDDFIIERELEPRYKRAILAKHRNHIKLFQNRVQIDRERYYCLPEPLNWIDWRNPYDNIFVWEQDDQKVASRGGNGSSGGRERNSMLILGLLELNKHTPVPSFLFVYTEKNELKFLKKFDRLCIPNRDIGSNYPACTNKQINDLKHGNLFMQWEPWHTSHIEIIKYD